MPKLERVDGLPRPLSSQNRGGWGSTVKAAQRSGRWRAAVDSWRPRLGKLALVDEKGGFALVDMEQAPTPSSGTGLRAYSGVGCHIGLEAVSSFQRRPYLIANITKGRPARGDCAAMATLAPVPGDSLPKEPAKELAEK